MPSAYNSRKENTTSRNDAIRAAFTKLYDGRRMRYDDVVAELCRQFYITPRVLERILKSK